jgi:hypothetical protein
MKNDLELGTNGLVELNFAEMMNIDGGLKLGFEHGFWIGMLTAILLVALL